VWERKTASSRRVIFTKMTFFLILRKTTKEKINQILKNNWLELNDCSAHLKYGEVLLQWFRPGTGEMGAIKSICYVDVSPPPPRLHHLNEWFIFVVQVGIQEVTSSIVLLVRSLLKWPVRTFFSFILLFSNYFTACKGNLLSSALQWERENI